MLIIKELTSQKDGIRKCHPGPGAGVQTVQSRTAIAVVAPITFHSICGIVGPFSKRDIVLPALDAGSSSA